MIMPDDVNPCNCDNECDKIASYGHFHPNCPFNGYDYTPHQISVITMRCGCLYHPLAKSVVNDVQR